MMRERRRQENMMEQGGRVGERDRKIREEGEGGTRIKKKERR